MLSPHQVVSIIESRARGLDLLAHNYYELLYAFHINRHNYRKGTTDTPVWCWYTLGYSTNICYWSQTSLCHVILLNVCVFLQRGQSCLSSGCVSVGRFGLVSAFRSRWIVTWLLSTVSASSDQSTPGSSSPPPELWYIYSYIYFTYKHIHISTNTYNYTHIQCIHTAGSVCRVCHCCFCLMQYERPGASPKRNSDGEFSSEPGDFNCLQQNFINSLTVDSQSLLSISFQWQ